MTTASPTLLEKSRKAHARILSALRDDVKQGAIALEMDVSDSQISRIKSDKLEDALALIYHAGFRVVPVSFVCVDRTVYEALNTIASKAMGDPGIVRMLSMGEHE